MRDRFLVIRLEPFVDERVSHPEELSDLLGCEEAFLVVRGGSFRSDWPRRLLERIPLEFQTVGWLCFRKAEVSTSLNLR